MRLDEIGRVTPPLEKPVKTKASDEKTNVLPIRPLENDQGATSQERKPKLGQILELLVKNKKPKDQSSGKEDRRRALRAYSKLSQNDKTEQPGQGLNIKV
jgi:hypothetical protein